MRSLHLNAIFGALLLTWGLSTAAAAPVAITHPGVADASAGDLKNIFLNQKTTWGNGDRVVLATLKGGATHEAFMKETVSKTASQFKSYWRKLVFTGKAKLPKAFASEAELVRFVASTPGAVGYIDDATPHDGVKVVR